MDSKPTQQFKERQTRLIELERDDELVKRLMMRSTSYNEVRTLRRLRAILLAWKQQADTWR